MPAKPSIRALSASGTKLSRTIRTASPSSATHARSSRQSSSSRLREWTSRVTECANDSKLDAGPTRRSATLAPPRAINAGSVIHFENTPLAGERCRSVFSPCA